MSDASLLFISSGLLLGWSLGANHAVNLFGTAVMSKMLRYRTAAAVAGVCVVIGAVVGGGGATRTITALGAVNALAGSFTVALSVAVAVIWMTRLKLPVSASQAIVGGVIGWNIFTGSPTDGDAIVKILGTWISSPFLAGVLAFLLYTWADLFRRRVRIHLLEIDAYTRAGLVAACAIASLALGANNIANVMGLFVGAAPLRDLAVTDAFSLSGVQQLFLLGGVAIAVGIATYGERVMITVGNDLFRITPLSGLVVVLAEGIVLFVFSSETLEALLRFLHLPTIPLAPVSSTQAVIGAVVGVGLAKQGGGINIRILGKIVAGWVFAPIVAFVLTFISLFFVQNVFEQRIIADARCQISTAVLDAAALEGVDVESIRSLAGREFGSDTQLRSVSAGLAGFSRTEMNILIRLAKVDSIVVDSVRAASVLDSAPDRERLLAALGRSHGRVYLHPIDFEAEFRSTRVPDDSTGSPLSRMISRSDLDSLIEAFRISRRGE